MGDAWGGLFQSRKHTPDPQAAFPNESPQVVLTVYLEGRKDEDRLAGGGENLVWERFPSEILYYPMRYVDAVRLVDGYVPYFLVTT